MNQNLVCIKRLTLLSVLAALASLPQTSSAQLGNASIIGVNNDNTPMNYLASQYAGSSSTASATQQFTGVDGSGNTQTMTFWGTSVNSSQYGSLHSYSAATLVNSYFNSTNSNYVDSNGNVADPLGSPDTLNSLGFSTFTDTFQFGGAIQSGYKAIYIFHADGTNSGTGSMADLAVNVDGNPGDSFFAPDPGPFSQDWVTRGYAINGSTPQQVYVQLSTQTVFNTWQLTDGQNYQGASDFSSTATLTGVEVVNQYGNLVSGWNLTSGSGTQYNTIESTPEPGTLTVLLGFGLPMFLIKRRRARN